MAKIQKYNIRPNPPITYKCDNSDYIKVSELREWIDKEIHEIEKSKEITSTEVAITAMTNQICALQRLLAAIDTEGK